MKSQVFVEKTLFKSEPIIPDIYSDTLYPLQAALFHLYRINTGNLSVS